MKKKIELTAEAKTAIKKWLNKDKSFQESRCPFTGIDIWCWDICDKAFPKKR